MTTTSFELTQYIGMTLSAAIDRPLGSKHPRWGFVYPLNYGYIPGVFAADGEELDVYVMGIAEPVQHFTGVCIAVIFRAEDVEGKLVLAPQGSVFNKEQIAEAVEFQEQFFDSRIFMPGDVD